MTDQEIEARLRQYRPVGPRPQLRARILEARLPIRLWPWAAAASLLFAVTLVLHGLAGRATERLHLVTEPDPVMLAVDELTEMLGGDEQARRVAEAVIDRERRQAEPAVDGVRYPFVDQEVR